jgi:glycine cleavage system H lipoate-binding protein
MAERIEAVGFKTVPNGEEKCIWMEAGVIDYKLCNNHYNCHTCTFDKGMKQTADKNALARLLGKEPEGKKGHIVAWREKMKRRQGLERKCRHTLTGRAPMRLCPYDYECSSCDFDQMLEDGLELQLPFHMGRIPQVDGYGLPEGHFFHVGHAWARIEAGGRIRVGLDDFSMRLFGPVDSIDLPLTGEEVKFSEVGLEFKRMGHEAAIMSPISGIVTAVNHGVAKDPTLVKEEPYNEGWLMVLDPTDMKKNLKSLLYGQQSVEWLHAEHQKLVEMISEVGMTYADGGYVEDVFANAPKIGWERLRQSFLRT